MRSLRVAFGLGALFLAGCASAHAIRIQRSDVIGPCQTTASDGDLFSVSRSRVGEAALPSSAAGLEALAGLRAADGASLIEKISHLSSVSGGSLSAALTIP